MPAVVPTCPSKSSLMMSPPNLGCKKEQLPIIHIPLNISRPLY
jgi:hypothetical protein